MEQKPTVVVTQQPAQQANVVVVQPVQSVRPLPQQWSTGFCNGPCCLGCIIPCMGLYYAVSNGPKERFKTNPDQAIAAGDMIKKLKRLDFQEYAKLKDVASFGFVQSVPFRIMHFRHDSLLNIDLASV